MPIRRLLTKYWFRPARLGWIAVYYPVMFPGWVFTFICIFFLYYFFILSSASTSTTWEMVLSYLPKAVIVFFVYDLACFRTGEYPSWWRNLKIKK